MDIKFDGKYKSITSFEWNDIPNFAIITGPNGVGKSQLLELIYNTINPITPRTLAITSSPKAQITGAIFQANEVTYRKGEWNISDTSEIDFSQIQIQERNQFSEFQQDKKFGAKKTFAFESILEKTGKKRKAEVTKEEFINHFPDFFVEHDHQLSQIISNLFFNYRLSEIELQAEGITSDEIIKKIGKKPWDIVREIIKASKLPFEINDPSRNKFRNSFILQLNHTVTKEPIKFSELSSGEKVLMSLALYLFSSQEKNVFPKLLLLDEPDAHLHPSMSQQFINVIKNVLVDKYGVQVIMTTHSPSTVILAPNESVYEMSIHEPRIRKSPTKNHAVSLLTAGLVYVGEGTKYILVEDKDDVDFYSYIYSQLIIDGNINADIPLVFIPASTKINSGEIVSGGKGIVQGWVDKIYDSGLVNILNGLIDADNGNEISDGVYKIDRYSIENYLADPLLVYAALLDKEEAPEIEGIELSVGEEYKLKILGIEDLQKVIDVIVGICEQEVKTNFPDVTELNGLNRIEVNFVDGKKLFYPQWLIEKRGKTIIHQVYNTVFTSRVVNFKTLYKAMRKLNIFPEDIANKFMEIKTGSQYSHE